MFDQRSQASLLRGKYKGGNKIILELAWLAKKQRRAVARPAVHAQYILITIHSYKAIYYRITDFRVKIF